MSTPLRISSGDERALGRSLRTWRALRRVKQLHAAELLGVSQATLSRWENGQSTPAPDESERLRMLMAARLDSAADRVFARLVGQSAVPVHLICDLTHRLLAESPAIEFHSRARDSDDLAILACDMRWVRFQLSDGSFARLVETVRPQPLHAVAPASQSASTVIESH